MDNPDLHEKTEQAVKLFVESDARESKQYFYEGAPEGKVILVTFEYVSLAKLNNVAEA